jgi:hypothetical protein
MNIHLLEMPHLNTLRVPSYWATKLYWQWSHMWHVTAHYVHTRRFENHCFSPDEESSGFRNVVSVYSVVFLDSGESLSTGYVSVESFATLHCFSTLPWCDVSHKPTHTITMLNPITMDFYRVSWKPCRDSSLTHSFSLSHQANWIDMSVV